MSALRTSRLLLRQWRDADIPAYASLNADREVRRWFAGTLSPEQSAEQAAVLRGRIETARAALAHGFGALGFDEIVAMVVPGNLLSRRVMDRLGMRHAPEDDFDHPSYPPDHPLRRHTLYRLGAVNCLKAGREADHSPVPIGLRQHARRRNGGIVAPSAAPCECPATGDGVPF